MSKQKKVAVEPNHAAEASAALGCELRRLREQKGLTINEVAARLKLPARQIETLERGEYVGLPEPVFVRGFLRSYGRFLGMDEIHLNDFLIKIMPVYQDYQRPISKGGVNYTNTIVKKSFPKWIWGVMAVVVMVGGVYAWQMKSASESAKQEESHIAAVEPNQNKDALVASNVLVKPMTASDTATETVTASAAAVPNRVAQTSAIAASVPAVMGVSGELVITTKYRTMLTVTDISGKVLINTIVPANSEHRFKEGAPFDVRIGYAVGTVANFAGTPIDIDSKRRGGKSVSFTAGATNNTN